MSLPLSLPPGTRIGDQYIVDSLINSGGFGAVYRGYDTAENNRLCAIKETYDVSPTARRRVLREVGVLLAVKNRHLPEVYDTFEEGGRFYLVMQLIPGQNLLQLLKARGTPFSEREMLGWLLPVIDMLQELHTRPTPVIHRDIKPANIIITPEGQAVLVDFGLTKLYTEDMTQTIERAVSEGFSPLEQYIGTTCPQSDIFSMAATMYMLLTNVTPPSTMLRDTRDELIDPRLLNPAISPHVERALLKALSLRIEDRFQSMREFSLALQSPTADAFRAQTVVQQPPNRSEPLRLRAPVPVPPQAASRNNQNAGGGIGGTVAAKNNVSPANKRNVPAQAPGNARPYPVLPPDVTPRPGQRTRTAPMVPARPLPGAFNQGCLWGSLQGVLAAAMVLLLHKEVYFYVAIAMGLAFYCLAGFMTTRRGGKDTRGAGAGFWAGIISTGIFWFIFGVGLFFFVLQRSIVLQQHGRTPNYNREFSAVWHLLMPVVSTHPIVQQRPGLVILIFALSGIFLAVCCGWIGGIVGRARHRAKVRMKAARVSARDTPTI